MNYKNFFVVGNTKISITNIEDTINTINELINKKIYGQLCVLDFGALLNSNTNKDYNIIVNQSLMAIPDGIPLVWLSKLWGIKSVRQTMGPQIFIEFMNNSRYKHYLLGDTEEVLDLIKKKFSIRNNNTIVGSYSPPYISLIDYDYCNIAKKINDTDADIVWISMTSPKQDFFGYNLLPYLEKKIVIGVGAAFRYSIDLYKIPSGFRRKIGLGGFMRKSGFIFDLKWYFKHSFVFLYFSISIIYNRFLGNKSFDKA